MNINKIAELILKEADLIQSIKRIIDLNLDDVVIDKGTKITNLLKKLEQDKESTFVEKHDLSDIRTKIEKSMELFQEAIEDLYSVSVRLTREKELT